MIGGGGWLFHKFHEEYLRSLLQEINFKFLTSKIDESRQLARRLAAPLRCAALGGSRASTLDGMCVWKIVEFSGF